MKGNTYLLVLYGHRQRADKRTTGQTLSLKGEQRQVILNVNKPSTRLLVNAGWRNMFGNGKVKKKLVPTQ